VKMQKVKPSSAGRERCSSQVIALVKVFLATGWSIGLAKASKPRSDAHRRE